ncbi:MAG: hypothetical protein M3198_14875 [Actinomycetota bacterium]|nr:hypothetical protein [Actinomycetota bacterium]
MARLRSYLVPTLLALGLVVLATRIPLIVAVAGDKEPPMPAACKSGPGAVRSALASAPRPVALQGAPLSACLSRTSSAAEVQQVGGDFLVVASGLAPQATRRPASRSATELGYLVGAVRKGAAATQGIHVEMVRRLEQEAVGVEGRSAAFRAGERAGRTSG